MRYSLFWMLTSGRALNTLLIQVPIMLPDDSDFRHGTREPRLGYSLSGRSHSEAHGQDTKTFRFVSTV